MSRNHAIDWWLLGEAVQYYRSIGYTYVEAPWFARREVLAMTNPPHSHAYRFGAGGGLIGSAEQSLLGMDLDGDLPTGRYVACTPCFRDDADDGLHQQTFMLVELYRNDLTDETALMEVLGHALGFHRRFVMNWSSGLATVQSGDGYGLELGGIEIGRYGLRQRGECEWISGTGLAEPRFTVARTEAQRRQAGSGDGHPPPAEETHHAGP